jgi:hypothetical protein
MVALATIGTTPLSIITEEWEMHFIPILVGLWILLWTVIWKLVFIA